MNTDTREQLQSKQKLLIAYIGVSLFAFLLVYIAVEVFLNIAFFWLLLGTEWELPAFLFPAFSIVQLHDIGIALASIGLVIQFLPITLTLVILQQTDPPASQIRSRIIQLFSHSDLFTILSFFGLFMASMGVWFCMHQAFLYLGEFLKGTIPFRVYVFLIFEIQPMLLHGIGNLFVVFGLLTMLSISTVKVVMGILSQMGML